MKRKDKYEELACDFKNEEECLEELEEEDKEVGDAEKEHFEETEK